MADATRGPADLGLYIGCHIGSISAATSAVSRLYAGLISALHRLSIVMASLSALHQFDIGPVSALHRLYPRWVRG